MLTMEKYHNLRTFTLEPKNEQFLNEIDYNLINISPYDLYYLKQIRNIRMILPWFLFFFGIIGNMFILIIFLRKSRLTTSNGLCFSALAISDSIALIFMLLRSLLKLQVLGHMAFSCKLIKYVYYSSLQISSWCLVLLTLDRLIAVVFVFKYRQWSKNFYSLKVLIGIVVTILIINSHLLVFISSKTIKNESNFNPLQQLISEIRISYGSKKLPDVLKACYVDPEENPIYYKYFYSKWEIAHGIIYGLIPFIIVFFSNIAIIWKLAKLRKNKITKSLVKKEKTIKVDSSIKSIQITIMLVSIAILFLVFTSPASIYMSFFYENLKSIRGSKKEYIKVVLRYVGYINNAINFYVYIYLSKEFRKEFVKSIRSLFRCLPLCKQNPEVRTSTTTIGSYNSSEEFSENKAKPKRLVRKNKFNISKDENFIKQKTLISTDYRSANYENDALEVFKTNTKNSKLLFYKEPNFKPELITRNNRDFKGANENANALTEPFISPNPTLV